MSPSAPVRDSTRRASRGVRTSPLAITGMSTAVLMAATVSYSAQPRNAHARVRPCTAMAAIPLSAAMRAMVTPFLRCGEIPVRIFSVTGTSTALVTAVRILSTSDSSARSADPAMTLQTFLAGQPMLMSMIWAP